MKFMSQMEILFPPLDQMEGSGETRPKGFPGPDCSPIKRVRDLGHRSCYHSTAHPGDSGLLGAALPQFLFCSYFLFS